MTDKSIGRAVVSKLWFVGVFQLEPNSLRQRLAVFDTPLVERINVPDHSLRENGVFVKGNQLAETGWREPIGKDCVRRAVSV